MSITIGIPDEVRYRILQKRAAAAGIGVISADARSVALGLRKQDLGAAFISPVEYARESSLCRIIPGPAVCSIGGISLYFREGIRSVSTLAADPAHVSEIVLARIVLAEEFESTPSIVPVPDQPPERMLEGAEAVLVVAGALTETGSPGEGLDLAEAWFDIVGLPFVHGVLCTREERLPPEDLAALIGMGRETKERAGDLNESERLPGYSYEFTNETAESLFEFLRYAHFHGVLPDIPELNIYDPGKESDKPSGLN